MRLIPRAASKLYADMFGYAWGPCPVCGTKFGGHEWPGIRDSTYHFSSIPIQGSLTTCRGICSTCSAAGVGCRAFATVGMYHQGCQFVTGPNVGSV